jgi:hypothetical protein
METWCYMVLLDIFLDVFDARQLTPQLSIWSNLAFVQLQCRLGGQPRSGRWAVGSVWGSFNRVQKKVGWPNSQTIALICLNDNRLDKF